MSRLVATVNETMTALKVGRAKLYELLNAGELESYLDQEGGSRKIPWRSIESYVERKLAEEVTRRGGAAVSPPVVTFQMDEGGGP